MVTARGKLRQQIFEIAGGICEYPQCRTLAVQLAHLHSIGMGGRKSADTMGNAMAACLHHALLSDGLYGSRDWYLQQLALIGIVPPVKAWNVAEALRVHIAKGRP